jgi:type II secretory pathway pseudopilin PulG
MICKRRFNRKGFTPSENKKSLILSSLTGFTLVEIIIAGLIISITAGGTFASYLYARQYSDKFRHRAMATAGASEIAEYIRYKLADGYRNSIYLNTTTGTYDKNTITAADPGYDANLNTMLDPATWGINSLVNDLDISYTVSDVWFDNNGVEKDESEYAALISANDPSMPIDRPAFKKITVSVTYDNRRAT